ncbi:MAG TPA: ABC transporter ATP-binding protein, partial [Eubacterium sp.]|nr:ABC transporter ATP-binding protein [Eubacterium sp.]
GERTVFFSTHNISDMENVTDYIMIMEKGKIVEQGYSKDIKEKYRFIKGKDEDFDKVLPNALNLIRTNDGFEGVILSENMEQIKNINIESFIPTLYQISVAIMKGKSKIVIPDL